MTLVNKSAKLRLRRVLRRRQKQVEAATAAAEKQFDKNLIGRFDRLVHVRRFVFGWLALVVLISLCTIMQTLALSSYYQTVKPVPGGIYHEGMVGTYSNSNPIFASGTVDSTVARLLFSGLLKYDDKNQLVGDLASSYSVDQTGKIYLVRLRPGLTWHDGAPLTASDVVFTFQRIQNPDVGSPLLPSWQGITIAAPNATTVAFTLPSAFSAFPYSLTTGIIPEHLLSEVPPSQLRASPFNTTQPVGAGPFKWAAIQGTNTTDPDKAVSLIELSAFKNYAHGSPKLNGFVVHAFGSHQEMERAFQDRAITAMAGLDELPSSVKKNDDVVATNFPSTAAMMTFFKTSTGVMADAQVRRALVQSADTAEVIRQLSYSAPAVKSPLLRGQIGYDQTILQLDHNLAAADRTLEKAGWVRGANGVRAKDGQQLSFRIYAEDNIDNRHTVEVLTKNWASIGANVTPVLQQLTDFKTTLEFHTYDALLYGISIGSDPDVYAYWDSTQADIRSTSRLNFSEYKSATADTALESGRTRLNADLRAIKYKPFLQAWQTDAPALGLYQPRFLYITRGQVYGLNEHPLNADKDRYDSVHEWQIHTARVTN